MKKIDSLNLIPFIDIMLVLLVIVLTSASFVQQSRIAAAASIGTRLQYAQILPCATPKMPSPVLAFFESVLNPH